MGLFSFPPTSPLYLSHLFSPLWGLSGSGGGRVFASPTAPFPSCPAFPVARGGPGLASAGRVLAQGSSGLPEAGWRPFLQGQLS